MLISAVTPVVCGIRPAFLVDNVSLEDDDLEILAKSLQEVISTFGRVLIAGEL
jgi:hypothetical protein